MAIVYCGDCGEKVSTDATACPHCGKPKEADTKNGWISSYVKYFAVISGTLTLAGSVIWFLYQRNVEIETHKQEIVRNTELAINRAETLKLSEKAETRQSKRSVLDLQLKTYASVLNNIAQINAMVMTRKTDGFDKSIKDFIIDYQGRMAFVEDRRTEVAMELVNQALLGLQDVVHMADKQKCDLFYITPILAHCMKISIAISWDFPMENPPKDDYCNAAHVSPFAAACSAPLTADAQEEFMRIQPSNYQAQKGGEAVGVPRRSP